MKPWVSMLELESVLWKDGYSAVCGVDEAGRGPLAGDVYAAAVVLSPEHTIEGLRDSKKLTEKAREALEPIIKAESVAWSIGKASVEEILHLNILQAALLAMRRAVDGLERQPDYILVDGNQNPCFPVWVPTETVVKGDDKSATIAAASILAKVARDRAMVELDKQYPQYGFAQHKGYPTAAHKQAILEHGISPVHRRGFRLYEGYIREAANGRIEGNRGLG